MRGDYARAPSNVARGRTALALAREASNAGEPAGRRDRTSPSFPRMRYSWRAGCCRQFLHEGIGHGGPLGPVQRLAASAQLSLGARSGAGHRPRQAGSVKLLTEFQKRYYDGVSSGQPTWRPHLPSWPRGRGSSPSLRAQTGAKLSFRAPCSQILGPPGRLDHLVGGAAFAAALLCRSLTRRLPPAVHVTAAPSVRAKHSSQSHTITAFIPLKAQSRAQLVVTEPSAPPRPLVQQRAPREGKSSRGRISVPLEVALPALDDGLRPVIHLLPRLELRGGGDYDL